MNFFRFQFIILSTCLLFSHGNFCSAQKKPGSNQLEKIPNSISKSPVKLAKYLVEGVSSDSQKVLKIYTWITNNIGHNAKSYSKLKNKGYSATTTLKRKKGTAYQFSDLFNTLCVEAGLNSKVVPGYCRSNHYYEDLILHEIDHSWNAVFVDSSWQLVDVFKGAGYSMPKRQPLRKFLNSVFKIPYRSRFKFFRAPTDDQLFVKPELFIEKCLPADPAWQLVQFPVSLKAFESREWSGYPGIEDSLVKKNLSPKDYNHILDDYRLLTGIDYFQKVAEESNIFNPRNHELLARAFFFIGSKRLISSRDSDARIAYNQESISYLGKSISWAKRQKRMVKSSNRIMMKGFEKRMKKEVLDPLIRQQKTIEKTIAINETALETKEKVVEGHKQKLKGLYDYILKKKRPLRKSGKSISKPQQNIGQKIRKSADLLESKLDSTETVILNLSEFNNRYFIANQSLRQEWTDLGLVLNRVGKSIIRKYGINYFEAGLRQKVETWSAIDSLKVGLRFLEKEQGKAQVGLKYEHADMLRSIVEMEKSIRIYHSSPLDSLLMANYKKCQALRKRIYQQKISIAKETHAFKMCKIEHHQMLSGRGLLSELNRKVTLNINASIEYRDYRISFLKFRRKKSDARLNTLIDWSEKEIKSKKKAIASLKLQKSRQLK